MDRIEKSWQKFKQLFGEALSGAQATDPDFQDILSHFIFGNIQLLTIISSNRTHFVKTILIV